MRAERKGTTDIKNEMAKVGVTQIKLNIKLFRHIFPSFVYLNDPFRKAQFLFAKLYLFKARQ